MSYKGSALVRLVIFFLLSLLLTESGVAATINTRSLTSRKSKQTVVQIKTVDVDRFNSRWPDREGTKTPHGYIGEGIAFEAKVGLQIFSGGVTQHDLPPNCQQNRTMENGQKRHAHGKRRPRATPWSACPRLCLTVFGHQSDFISTLTKRKAQMNAAPSKSLRGCAHQE